MSVVVFNNDGTATVPVRELLALASAVVHAEELLSPDGHHVDRDALSACVVASRPILDELDGMAMLPVKRSAS